MKHIRSLFLPLIAFASISAIVASSPPAEAQSKSPPQWGYVNANLTCKPEYGNQMRLKITSQVFAYCWEEIRGDAIVESEMDNITQAAKLACPPGDIYLTNAYVDSSSTKALADASLLKTVSDFSSFPAHATIYASESRYSTKCR